MRTSHYRCYPVKLQSGQRAFLEAMLHTSRTPAEHYLVARVLLMSDQSQGHPGSPDGQIAEARSLSRHAVIRSALYKETRRESSPEAFHESVQNGCAWMAKGRRC